MFNVGVFHFLILGAMVFTIGILGVIMNRKSLIHFLMSVEVVLISVNLNFVAFSTYLRDISGQIFTMLILAVAAAETAIGLALIIVYYHNKGNVNIKELDELKG